VFGCVNEADLNTLVDSYHASSRHWPEAKLHYHISKFVVGASRVDHILSSLAAIGQVDKETQPGALHCEISSRGNLLFLNRTREEATAQADVMLKYLREGKAKWMSKGLRFNKDTEAVELTARWLSPILQGQFRIAFSSQHMPLKQLKEGVELRIELAHFLVRVSTRSEGATKFMYRGVSACYYNVLLMI
jgi:hypothetical protein